MTDAEPTLRLTFPSDLRFLIVARTFIESICKLGSLDDEVSFAITLASGEAIANSIRHANRNRKDAAVELSCRYCAEGLEICIADDGAPFDLTAVPELDPSEQRVGGRGVFLMRRLMDELTCQPRAGGGNLLRMLKRCLPKLPEIDLGEFVS